MYFLYSVTGLALLISFIGNREKTFKAVKIAFKKLAKILPAFLTMLIFVSIVIFLIPDKTILHYLGNNNKFISLISASFFGSITLMPGFIAFPLCGILLKKGVSYMVLSAFTTTLMMV
ncbi:MAG: permease, partial [Candidatus Cloacimonetes bacterium]|nr:permease [Candidatus Cloacimonadota bacterium]